MPAYAASVDFWKKLKVDIFDKSNPLGNLGFIFTMNQMIYLLVVMWVFSAVPEKMVMVYAMVFGAHLLPYSWLYRTKTYIIAAIVLPVLALALGLKFSSWILAAVLAVCELVFSVTLIFLSARQRNSLPSVKQSSQVNHSS